jgi:rRNA maturation endonuclease Nob1
VRREEIGKKFDPEKYGMIFCPSCYGSGRSFNNPEGGHVCKVCGGFGLIKRENDLPDKREGPDQIAVLRL